jgi:hypothetical protein
MEGMPGLGLTGSAYRNGRDDKSRGTSSTSRTNSNNLITDRPRNNSAKNRKAAEPLKVTNNNGDEGREWTDFEMQAVLALICKRVHLDKGGALTFATALNEALNGKPGEGSNMSNDIDVQDVEVLLEWIYREKKGAL